MIVLFVSTRIFVFFVYAMFNMFAVIRSVAKRLEPIECWRATKCAKCQSIR